MPIPKEILDQILGPERTVAAVKRGEEIFEGTDYPRTWDGFIGQDRAKEHLRIAVASAKARGTRVDHVLLASGIHGVGKSTLATLLAAEAGVGLVQTTGPLTAQDAQGLLANMEDRDVLFIDEAHTLTLGGRNKADWLLPLMTEGVLYTERGAQVVPAVTIVAATTDVGRLPQTLVSRFFVQPTILPYNEAEATLIVGNLCERMDISVPAEHRWPIAKAADKNPRMMRQILTAVRDLSYAYPDTHPNLEKAFEWAGVSADGLTGVARDMLVLLFLAPEYTLAQATMAAKLGEPGPLHYHEQQLLQRQLVDITGRGRKLTDEGVARALAEVRRLRG